LDTWRKRGAEIVAVNPTADALADVKSVLTELGRRAMTNVLVEGGAGTLGSFHDAGEIDEVHAFVAPRLVGGPMAPSPIGGIGIAQLGDALALAEWTVERVGEDILIHGIGKSSSQ
jgi:diaminohydroxyphosphoribosylaminopyrimidine deaminase/5-amino-6-(5-phosphoribosylamino)uracil reductase